MSTVKQADEAMNKIWADWLTFYQKHFRGEGVTISMADQIAFYEIAQPILRDLAMPKNLWRVNAAVPGLNVPFFIYSHERPTHEEINEVWMRTSGTPLKSPEESSRVPLRDAYPAYVSVEMIPVSNLGSKS